MPSSENSINTTQAAQASDKNRESQPSKDKAPSLLHDFARSAAYAAIQSPAVAIGQVFDKATRSSVAENIHIIDKPNQAEFGSTQWYLQQAGAAVGGLIPFMASLAITKKASVMFDAESIALNASKLPVTQTASLFRAGEMASAGFFQGAAFDPNENKDSFFKERLIHAVTSGVTMGSMHMMSGKLSEYTGASLANASLLNKALTTGLAGAGGSAVGLATDVALTGRQVTGKDALQSIYQGAWTGTVLGGIGSDPLRLHEPKSKLPDIEEYFAREKRPDFSQPGYLDWQRQSWNPFYKPKAETESSSSLETYGPLEKAEIVARLAREADPLLSKPEVMHSFVERIDETYDKHLKTAADLWGEQLDRITVLKEAKDLQDRHIDPSLQDGRDYAGIKRMIKKAERRGDELYDEMKDELEIRRENLESTVNQFLALHDIPPIALEAVPSLADGSSASYRDGRVTVTEKYLKELHDQPEVANLLYHELTHLRQDVLYINALADSIGLPKEPNAEQMLEFKQTVRAKLEASKISLDFRDASEQADFGMKDAAESSIDLIKLGRKTADDAARVEAENAADDARLEQLVDNVIEIRRTKDMSAEDRAYAKNMVANVDNYFKSNYVQGEAKLYDAMSKTENAIDFLDADLTSRFLYDTVTNPEKLAATYGFKSIPRSLTTLAEDYRKWGGNEDIDRYQNGLRQILVDHFLSVQSEHDALEDLGRARYYDNPLERQAHSTGILAELAMKQRYPNYYGTEWK